MVHQYFQTPEKNQLLYNKKNKNRSGVSVLKQKPGNLEFWSPSNLTAVYTLLEDNKGLSAI